MVNYTYIEKGVFSRLLFRTAVCVLILCIALGIPALMAFRAEAEVTLFHSSTYREEGAEIIDPVEDKKSIQYEHFWSDFKGDIPKGASDENNIFLRFSWSVVTRTVVGEVGTNTPSDSSLETAHEVVSENEVTDGVENNEGTVIEEVPLEQGEETFEDVSEPQSTESVGAVLETALPVSVPMEEDMTVEEPVPESEIEESHPSDTEGFEQVTQGKLYAWAQALIEEKIDEKIEEEIEEENKEETEEKSVDESVAESVDESLDENGEGGNSVASDIVEIEISENEENSVLPDTVVIEQIPDVIIAESISTTSGFVSSDIVVEDLTAKSFEVQYTIDGATWISLGSVGFDDSRETTFDLSHIGLEAVSDLQIAIRYTVREGESTKIIFDSMRLEVGYGAPLIEEIIEPVGHDDREPNFEVSAIKSDVQSENIRAVVLERGGVFDFWYSVTNTQSGEIVWNKILGGGAIDENAPIDIKKRTIFWLDRNQQTLFAFSVDEESIFAVPFQDPENKVFLLPFTDENGRQWEAMFNSEQNTLEFSRVKS